MSTTPRTPPSLLATATTIVIIFTIHLIPLTSAAPSSPCPSWSYNQSLANGPQNWGSLCSEYASCRDGTQQSPVNLVDQSAEEVGNQLNNLHLNYRPLTNFTLISTRFTVEVCAPPSLSPGHPHPHAHPLPLSPSPSFNILIAQ